MTNAAIVAVIIAILSLTASIFLPKRIVPFEELPDLDLGDVPVSPHHVTSFRRDGHVRVDALLSRTEADAYAPHIRAAVKTHKSSSAPFGPDAGLTQEEKADAHGAFVRVDHLRLKEGRAPLKLAMSQRLGQAVAKVLGVDKVRLYKDTAFFKHAKDTQSPWHQDLVAAPFNGVFAFVTLWLALSPINEDMGALWFADGSHQHGRFNDNLTLSGEEVYSAYNVSQTGRMKPGDATLHAGWTIHGAPPNYDRQGRTREAIAISYVVDGTSLISWEEWKSRGSDDKETWTIWHERGYPLYGTVLDNPLCPIVYHNKTKSRYVHDPRKERREKKKQQRRI